MTEATKIMQLIIASIGMLTSFLKQVNGLSP